MQWFGPEYKLDVRPTSMENLNTEAYLEGLRSRLIDNLRTLPFAPSVQMQPTPGQAINAHAEGGMSADEDEEERRAGASGRVEPTWMRADDDDEEEGEGGKLGELEKRIAKSLERAEIKRRIETPVSESDDSEAEDGHHHHHHRHHGPPTVGTSSQRDRLHRLLSSGNSRLDSRSGALHRSLLSEDIAASATAAATAGSSSGTTTPWYSNVARPRPTAPSVLAGSGYNPPPPEALRRILSSAARSSSYRARANGRANGRRRGPMEMDDDDDQSEADSADDEGSTSADEDMDDESDSSDVEDDGSFVGGRRRRRRRLDGGRLRAPPPRLTKVGRPRRSFFDQASPFERWSSATPTIKSNGASRALPSQPNGDASTSSSSPEKPLIPTSAEQQQQPPQSENVPPEAVVAAAIVGGGDLSEQAERERELERGRRGEGGGSEDAGRNANGTAVGDVEMAS